MKVILGLTLVYLALTGCAGGDEPAPPTAQPPADARVVGPWVVFLSRTGVPGQSQSGGTPPWTITTYSLGARDIAASIPIQNVGQAGAVLVGDEIILDEGYALYTYTLHGPKDTTKPFLTHSYSVSGMAVSPDGGTLALTYRNQDGDVCDAGGCIPAGRSGLVRFVDARTAEDVGTVYGTKKELEGFTGDFSQPVWRDDGTGVLVRGRSDDGIASSLATVFIDGRVRSDVTGEQAVVLPGPNARRAALLPIGPPCGAESARHQISILDVDRQTQGTIVKDALRDLEILAWSPDGAEVLYSSTALVPDTADECPPSLDESTRQWGVAATFGTLSHGVTGPVDQHREWYGERALTYTCDGVRQLDARCGVTGFAPVEMYVGDDLVASVIEPVILGFIEQDSAP